MNAEKSFEIATTYADGLGYDVVRHAGEKDGYFFFHIMRSTDKHRKLGLPFIIGIDKYGKINCLDQLDEIMWACHEEMKLLK